MTIDFLRKNNLIIFECIAGSRAYNLHTEKSDTDIRGVFILPEKYFFGFEYVPQVSNESNDIVFYELKRFLELLGKNNPNILELLNIPENCIIQEDAIYQKIKSFPFLSKLCKDTFAGYAMTQIKKARGLNKKILNPVEKERKTILDFCFITKGQGSGSLKSWLLQNNYKQENCALVNIANMKNIYALFHNENLPYKGIMQKEDSNEVALSSIPKSEKPVTYLYFNQEGYSAYCKTYKSYWDWVEKRNEERYQNTLSHSKNYDAKNLMHTFRLLTMAKEIATKQEIKVKRDDRDFLLSIKAGKFEYEELVQKAEQETKDLEYLYKASSLVESPNIEAIETLLIEIRQGFYFK